MNQALDSQLTPASLSIDAVLGTVVAGRYEIKRRIGSGGMGTVYEAEQVGLGRPVALKMLRKDVVSDPETVARFHQEARATSLLVHPNTVRVFDFGEDDTGSLFLAMEYLEGELLTQRLARGTIDVQEAMRIIQGVLRSLSEAHSKGLVHRDLKPDNIYLARVEGNSQPVVKVLDFGIAKTFRPDVGINQYETAAGTVFGTPRYMSPEQAQGKPLDPRSDLYSVGILLFHLIAGRTPFVDDQAVVVMAKHIKEPLPNLRELAAHQPIPASLLRTVQKALAKDPIERFQTADEFHQALSETVQDVEQERRRMATASGSVQRVSGREPSRIAFAFIALGLVALGVLLVLFVRGRFGHTIETPVTPAIAIERATAPTVPTPVVVIPGPTANPQTQIEIKPPENANVADAALQVAVNPDARRLSIASRPEGAEVWAGSIMMGRTPFTLQLPPGHEMELEFRLSGYESQRIEANRLGVETVVELTRERTRPRVRNPATGRDPYQRFGTKAGARGNGYGRF